MERLALDRVKTAQRQGRPLTVDPPGNIDVEEGEDQDEGAEDWGDDVLESRDPRRHFRRGSLGGKGAVCLGAVVGPDVGRRWWWW